MAITRYTGRTISPWRELEDLSTRLGRFFDEESWPRGSNGGNWLPAVNVEESGEELLLTAEMPGMSRDDIELELENGVLTIRGEKREEREEGSEERRYHVWERRYGTFQRSFTLPRTVRAEDINADFRDGVLHVRMPKSEEAKGRRIQIGSGE